MAVLTDGTFSYHSLVRAMRVCCSAPPSVPSPSPFTHTLTHTRLGAEPLSLACTFPAFAAFSPICSSDPIPAANMASDSDHAGEQTASQPSPQVAVSGAAATAGDAAAPNEPVKTAKQLKKELEKQAKLDKFKQKQLQNELKDNKPKDKVKQKVEKKEKVSLVYDKETAVGEKKDTSGPLPDAYCPQYVEAAWYQWWEKSGFFAPEVNCPDLRKKNPKGQFVMVIPPPNVTGVLHLGHALTTAIEDSLTRWHRMCGRTTLWAPGCDHAGIATQVVVEKKVWRSEHKTRHDLGRDEFVKRVWDWKNEKGDRIYNQFRLLGASVDWSRTTFTMDPKMSRAVVEGFVLLFDRGLIYRRNRLVNWSCALKSAISDIEVDKIEIPGRTLLSVPGHEERVEFGVLISFAYKVDGSDEEVVVATTRIETMLGDTAVAVHPADPRYAALHGKFVIHPFLQRKLPIVCHDFVEMGFGTGAVKITPAHDPNDYEVGKKLNLPFITIFDDSGCIADGYGQFSGMKRFVARTAVLKELQNLGLYRGTKDNPMVVPICSRSKDVVEPMLKVQWYVNCQTMAEKAVSAVRSGDLKFIPEAPHTTTWYHWLENIQDWCISRQLWWGHRIPVYFVTSSEKDLTAFPDDERWIAGRSEDEARVRAAVHFAVPEKSIHLTQDEDVLDTWFSAGMFPFASFGWPDQTLDLESFYPGNLLETGYDIIFFWVARMVMLGVELLGQLPFREVYMHTIIRDAHGRKMSKSLGNVLDPIDLIRGISLQGLHDKLNDSNLDPKEIETATSAQKQDYPDGIPECGTDALRFALCAYLTQGRDINLDIKRVEGYRFFCNKIWNAMKLVLQSLGPDFHPLEKEQLTGHESKVDRWLLSRVVEATDDCGSGFSSYDLSKVTTACHKLFVYELCDIYLESVKPIFASGNETEKGAARQTLYSTASIVLRLMHPLMPFITEELYQRLGRRKSEEKESICISEYPATIHFGWKREQDIENDMELAQQVCRRVRNLRTEYNLAKKKVKISMTCDSARTVQRLRPFLSLIQVLTLAEEVCVLPLKSAAPAETAVVPINELCGAFLHISGLIDVSKETERLQAKKSKIEVSLLRLQEKMSAADYAEKVPAEVRDEQGKKADALTAELQQVEVAVKGISKLTV